MKKLLAILLALIICFSFAACRGKLENRRIHEYIEANKEDLLEGFEESFEKSSGMTCTTEIKVRGMGFEISINVNELSDIDAETRNQLQATYDSMDATFEMLLDQMQEELPELEYFEIVLRDKEDFVIAAIKTDGKVDTPIVDDENEEESNAPVTDSLKSNQKIVNYINLNKADLLEGFESSFASSSGMTCTSDVEVIGMGFVITININELENVDSSTKAQLQSTYDSMSSTFEPLLDQMQTELPELEYFEIDVCDKNGDLLATIVAGEK